MDTLSRKLGARAQVALWDARARIDAFHEDERGGLGGQQAIISAGLIGIGIAVVAVLVAKAGSGAESIPDAPAVTTSFP